MSDPEEKLSQDEKKSRLEDLKKYIDDLNWISQQFVGRDYLCWLLKFMRNQLMSYIETVGELNFILDGEKAEAEFPEVEGEADDC